MRLLTVLIIFSVFLYSGCADSSSEHSQEQETNLSQQIAKPVINAITQVDSTKTIDSLNTIGNTLKEKVAKNVPSSSGIATKEKQTPPVKKPVLKKPIVKKDPVKANPVTTSPPKSKPVTIPKPVIKKIGPRISFNNKNFKYGQIKEGKEIDHSFFFRNTGDEPLEIMNVSVTCGCTVPTYSFMPILPGATSKIDVHYDSKGKMSSQKATITVLTNSTSNPTEKLFLEGYVMPVWKDEKKDSTKTKVADGKKDLKKEGEKKADSLIKDAQAQKDGKTPPIVTPPTPPKDKTPVLTPPEKKDSTNQGN